LVAEGKVTVNGVVCVKAALAVSEADVLAVSEPLKYVSRGGLKLEHALNTFGIELGGKVCMDVGASTGGFTDCMLQHGASRVYAVDVGTNQLDASLRADSRVVSMEQCDIRGAAIPAGVRFTAVDVSFISVKLILPHLPSDAVVLIKPQFEYGIRHKGVIHSVKTQDKIAAEIAEFARQLGFEVKGMTDYHREGKNREFLMYVNKSYRSGSAAPTA
jgi:23S rRNA (cytidine1920-2'-O)/16S rRNA (cytidine1409-2'-O)-methyltransferase